MPRFAPEFVRLKARAAYLISSRARKRSTVLNRHAIYIRQAARYQRADQSRSAPESSQAKLVAGAKASVIAVSTQVVDIALKDLRAGKVALKALNLRSNGLRATSKDVSMAKQIGEEDLAAPYGVGANQAEPIARSSRALPRKMAQRTLQFWLKHLVESGYLRTTGVKRSRQVAFSGGRLGAL